MSRRLLPIFLLCWTTLLLEHQINAQGNSTSSTATSSSSSSSSTTDRPTTSTIPTTTTATSTTSTSSSSTSTSNTPSPTPDDKCMLLGEDSICDKWARNAVNLEQLQRTYPGKRVDSIENYNTLVSNPLSNQRTDLFYSGIKAVCPDGLNDIVLNTQYLATFFCFRDVAFYSRPETDDTTSLCRARNDSPPPQSICKSTCDSFIESIKRYIGQHSNKCQSDPDEFLDKLREECLVLNPSNSNEDCVGAIKQDEVTCGFPKSQQKEAREFCRTSSSSCCAQLSFNDSAGNNGQNSNTGLIIGVVLGVIGVILGGVILVVVCARLRSANGTTDGYHHKKDDFYNPESAHMFSPAVVGTIGGGRNSTTPRPATLERNNMYDNSAALLQRYAVTQDYIPQMDDELDLRIGDQVIVQIVYADGWVQGLNETTGQAGTLPLGLLEGYESLMNGGGDT